MTVLLTCLLLSANTHSSTITEVDAWKSLKDSKVVAIMRHAIAPGNGDPSEFALGDCTTQRNLSEQGRQQARIIGAQMKEYGISGAQIFSSQWCRCIDTATELGLGIPQALPMINSFFQDRSTAKLQTAQLRSWIRNRLKPHAKSSSQSKTTTLPTAVLVTHQVNITALTGVFPASGEIVFVALDADKLTAVTSVVIPY